MKNKIKNLYEEFVIFLELTPWKYIHESFLIGIREKGKIYWCSILGSADEVHGVCIYRDKSGLNSYVNVTENYGPPSFEVLMGQDAIVLTIGPTDETDPEMIELNQSAGLPGLGNDLHFSVADYFPGLIPTLCDSKSLHIACKVLTRLNAFIEHVCFKGMKEFEDNNLVLLPESGASWEQWREYVVDIRKHLPKQQTLSLSKIMFAKKSIERLHLEKMDCTWQIHSEMMPMPIQNGLTRGFFPKLLVIISEESEEVITFNLFGHKEWSPENISKFLSGFFSEKKIYPDKIIFESDEIEEILDNLLENLDISIEFGECDLVHHFMDAMVDDLQAGGQFPG